MPARGIWSSGAEDGGDRVAASTGGKRNLSWLTRGAILGVVAAIVAVVVVDFLRPRVSSNALTYARAAQELAAPLPVVPLHDSNALEGAVSALVDAEVSRLNTSSALAADMRSAGDLHDAVQVCVRFLQVCASGRAGDFEQWAATQRKLLPPAMPAWGPYTHDWYVDRFTEVVGRRPAEPLEPQAYFLEYFNAYWSGTGAELRPEALVSDPSVIEIKTASFTHWGDFIGASSRTDGLGATFWTGGVTIGGLMLWWPERVIAEAPPFLIGAETPKRASILDIQKALFDPFIKAHGSIDAARVMLLYRSTRGINVPAHFFLIRRPDGGWEMTGLHLCNIGSEVGVGSRRLEPPVY